MVWYVSVYEVRKGRIRRTNSTCNELMYRPLESVRKCKPCGQADRQTDIFAFAKTETQFYKLRIYARGYAGALDGRRSHTCMMGV